jgi:ABC-type Fe3+/spermidine/putrescine transport system ATPase subunit
MAQSPDMTGQPALAARAASATAGASATEPHLVAIDLGRRFGIDEGGDWAVHESNFEVARGEFFGLLGPSGCGKSTTLNLIAGFLEPTSGEVRLSGKLLNGVPPHQRGTAMVFQDYALFPHLSAADNIAFGLRLRRRRGSEISRRVAELLELVGLSHRSGNLPAQLSGGEQQRVALARALAVDPEVVLLDEPLSNLDARLRVQMRRELKRILGEAGVTVIFVTHDQAEAFAICDRVAVMRKGLIEDLGEPDRLYRRPQTVDVARFVGEGNFFPAEVLERHGDQVRLKVKVGSESVTAGSQGDSSAGTTGQLLVRPESVRLIADGKGHVRGRVNRIEFQGAITQYEVDTGETRVRVHALSAAGRHGTGQEVALTWHDADSVFFPDKEV